MNVTEVKQNPKKPENAFVKFDDGTDAWCPDYEKAKTLVIGQPLPPDWRQDVGDFGPRVFPPSDRKGGGGGGKAAYANTQEGLHYAQERSDRRTALMQAVALTETGYAPAGEGDTNSVIAWDTLADSMYGWLRYSLETSGGASGKGATTQSGTAPSPGPSVEGDPASRGSSTSPARAPAHAPEVAGSGPTASPAPGSQGRTSPSTSSEPVGESSLGEGEPTPAGSDFTEKLDRVYTIAGGSAAKVMLFVKDRYPAWRPPDGDVGSVSDLKDWHLDQIIEDYG